MRSHRSRILLAAMIALGCLSLAASEARADDAPAASSPRSTPEQEKAELLADMKQLVIGNNMEDADFLEKLFKVNFTPVMFPCHAGCTAVGFRPDKEPIGFSIAYSIYLQSPPNDFPGSNIEIHLDPEICVTLKDLDWWSNSPPVQPPILDGDGKYKHFNFPLRRADDVHTTGMSATFAENNCMIVVFLSHDHSSRYLNQGAKP